MERYFYHGIGDYVDTTMIDKMLEIIDSGGLKSRSVIRGFSDEYNHVCLYKKNEDYDYSDINALIHSARGGWIDHCFGFIISPDVSAKKVKTSNWGGFEELGALGTDLVDEWRSDGDISLDKIVGIMLPFDSISDCKREFSDFLTDDFDTKLFDLVNSANNLGLMVINSDEVDFCDKLDEQLNTSKKSGMKR